MSDARSKPADQAAAKNKSTQADSSDNQPGSVTYRDAGVDIDAGNRLVEALKPLARSTCRPGCDSDLGGFGGLFDLAGAGFTDPVLVAANDGVGTKLKIAIDTGRHESIGIDLVAMCVNDLIVQGAEPLFFLDYFSCGKLDLSTAEAVISGIAEGCRQAGCGLIGGETAEMPGLYGASDYDLAGFAVGAVERGDILPRRDIAAGDVLLGLASSGPHSNGYSLIRRLVADEDLNWDAPAPFATGKTVGEALITPTRIYVRPVLNAIKRTGAIKALAHITGGGLSENIPRVLPAGLNARIDLSCWQSPTVFDWLQRAGRMDTRELARTFNCGIGMVLVVAPDDAEKVMEILRRDGEEIAAIGHLDDTQTGENDRVSLSGRLEFAP